MIKKLIKYINKKSLLRDLILMLTLAIISAIMLNLTA